MITGSGHSGFSSVAPCPAWPPMSLPQEASQVSRCFLSQTSAGDFWGHALDPEHSPPDVHCGQRSASLNRLCLQVQNNLVPWPGKPVVLKTLEFKAIEFPDILPGSLGTSGRHHSVHAVLSETDGSASRS